MFKVSIAAGGGNRFAPAAEDLDLDPDMFHELEVLIELSNLAGKLHVQIQARATVALECDRTLRPFTLPVAGSYELVLLPLGESVNADEDIEPLFIAPGQNTVDLTVPVRDTLLLAIPTRRVAPDAEESELQTVFGAAAKDVNWRWEALHQL